MTTNLTKLKMALKDRRAGGSLIFNLKATTNGVVLVCDDVLDNEVLYRGKKIEEFLTKAYDVLRDFILSNNLLSAKLDLNDSDFLQDVMNAPDYGTIKLHRLRLDFDEYKKDKFVVFDDIQKSLLKLRLEIGYPTFIQEYNINHNIFTRFDTGLDKVQISLLDNSVLHNNPLLGRINTFPNKNIVNFDIVQDCDLVYFKQLLGLYSSSCGIVNQKEYNDLRFHYSVYNDNEYITGYTNMIDQVLYGTDKSKLTRNDLTPKEIEFCDTYKSKVQSKDYKDANEYMVSDAENEIKKAQVRLSLVKAIINNEYCKENKISAKDVLGSYYLHKGLFQQFFRAELHLPPVVLEELLQAL